MKRPAFQFYPGDWLRNANLRRCSHAARGAWMDVLCVLHDSDEYGLIRWPLADLANACAAPIRLLRELVDKGVLKGCDKGQCEPFIYTPRSGRKDGDPVTLVAQQAGPIWYSSRMVKDEYVRTIRGESSRFGDSPDKPPKATPKAAPKPPIGDGSTSASATAVSSEPNGSDAGASPPTPKDRVFAFGVPLLTAAGVTDKNARSMLAGLCKRHGEEAVADAIDRCAQQQAIEPVSWLQAALKPSPGKPGPSTPRRGTERAPDIFEAGAV